MADIQKSSVTLPVGHSTVSVSIINTTTAINCPPTLFMEPQHEIHTDLKCPSYSFLIEHKQLNRNVIFDLGLRKDWKNLPPSVVGSVDNLGFSLRVDKDVRSILEDNGYDASSKKIEAVIWSHAHFDHVGDMSRFDPGTSLIVGPGSKKQLLPGYPADNESSVLASDFKNREVKEVSFADSTLKIGQLQAVDFFGDGSLYLLDAPGHMVGHLCALARVTCQPDSFLLLAGDSVHHAAQLRPSTGNPLMAGLTNEDAAHSLSRPEHSVSEIHQHFHATRAFYDIAECGLHHDPATARETTARVQQLDAVENIMVFFAHDATLLDVVDFFPKPANDAIRLGWKEKAKWLFINDLHPPPA